jgi:hypothetical protein
VNPPGQMDEPGLGLEVVPDISEDHHELLVRVGTREANPLHAEIYAHRKDSSSGESVIMDGVLG